MSSSAAPDLPNYDGSLALTFVSLALVCLVAWLVLRLLARRGPGGGTGAVRILARCPLEPRRSVYVVEAGSRCFLIGVGDGSMSLLAELAPDTVRTPDLPKKGQAPRFAEVLARVMGRS